MQSNSEAGIPSVYSNTIYKAKEVYSKNEKPFYQPTEVMSERQASYNIEDGASSSETFQKLQAKGQQRIRGRQKPSLTVWHLILVLGDVILFMALLGLLLFFHLIPQASRGTLASWDVKFIWLCFALVSWSLAVKRIGRFLRATHLDELPQVLNILRGDMSLIGPRPEREEFTVKLEETIPFYRCRLAVKPGLTGWAQVKYRYGNTDNDTLIKLQYDLYYIKRQSFMLDLFIILKTVAEVLSLRGT